MSGNGNRFKTTIQRFDEKWTPEPYSGCWLWSGALSDTGYGIFHFEGKLMGAHKASWVMRFGKIGSKIDVCHRCDTPSCVNPSHLFTGTRSDNMQDCISKGRKRFHQGYGTMWETVRSVRSRIKKKKCKRGHLLSGYNLVITTSGSRSCRECGLIINRACRERKRKLTV